MGRTWLCPTVLPPKVGCSQLALSLLRVAGMLLLDLGDPGAIWGAGEVGGG